MRSITDDQKREYLAWLRAGASPARAAAMAGCGESTIRKLRKRDPAFDRACAAVMPKSGRRHAADPERIKSYLRLVAHGVPPTEACRQVGLRYAAVQPSRVAGRDPLFAMKIDWAKKRGRLAREMQEVRA